MDGDVKPDDSQSSVRVGAGQGDAEKYLQTIVSASHDAILVIDKEGRFEFGNEAFFRIFGWPKEELLGHPFIKVVPPDQHEFILQRWEEVQRGEGTPYEVDIVTQEGKRRSLSVSHRHVDVSNQRKYCVVAQDVTEHRKAERALRREKAFADVIIDAIPGLFYVLDRQGRFVRWNRTGEELTGLSPEELRGMDALLTIAKDDRARVARAIAEVFDKGQAETEAGVIARNEIRHFLLTGRRMDVDGDVYLVGSGIDITERKRAEDSLRSAHDQLEQRINERTAELTEVVGQLYEEVGQRTQAQKALRQERRTLEHLLRASDHERQLIAYEIHDGLAQQLAGAILQFQGCEYRRDAKAAGLDITCDTGMRLVRQAHAESRRLISDVRPPILDESGVKAAITYLINEQQRRDTQRIEFHSEIQFERLDAILENAIYRIVQEGLTNACRHSQSDRVRIELVQHGQQVRIEIRDWGVGFTDDAVQEGGFGVAGIKERTRLLGGTVTIDSQPGQGSRITVELPLIPRQRDV